MITNSSNSTILDWIEEKARDLYTKRGLKPNILLVNPEKYSKLRKLLGASGFTSFDEVHLTFASLKVYLTYRNLQNGYAVCYEHDI